MAAIACPVTANQIIATASAEVGNHESPFGSNKQPYGEWYGMNGVAWCAIFVSWVLHHAGWNDFGISTGKGYSYCPTGADWFRQRGAWADKTVTPKRGWVVFFDFPSDGVNRISHTGLVEGVLADGRVATIEGNTNPAGGRTGGEVMRHNRTPAGGIVGYGVLAFPANQEDDMIDQAKFDKLAYEVDSLILPAVARIELALAVSAKQPITQAHLDALSDDDVKAIAKAVNDEAHKRSES